jgi:hypothetical protein
MDQTFATRRQPNGLSAGLQAFRSILHWLVGLIRVTPDDTEGCWHLCWRWTLQVASSQVT